MITTGCKVDETKLAPTQSGLKACLEEQLCVLHLLNTERMNMVREKFVAARLPESCYQGPCSNRKLLLDLSHLDV